MEFPRKFVLPAANFFAALGGGGILGAGLSVFPPTSWSDGISPLAMLLGTATGFLLLISVGFANSKRFHHPRWMSGLTLLVSAALLILFQTHALNNRLPPGLGAWFFFTLLVVRWASWYSGRAIRTAIIKEQIINKEAEDWRGPLVESAYFFGVAAGLLLQAMLKQSGLESLFVWVMIGDLVGNGLAFVLDSTQASPPTDKVGVPQMPQMFFRSIALLCGATIGMQIMIFASASHFVDKSLASVVLATFYLGGMVGMLIVSSRNVRLISLATVAWGRDKGETRGELVWLLFVGFIATALSLVAQSVSVALSLPLVMLAAVCNGIISIAVIKYIGRAGFSAVAIAFGAMAFGCALGMVVIEQIVASPPALLAALIACMGLTLTISKTAAVQAA